MSMLAIFAVQCDVMVWCDAKGGRVLFDGETPRGDGGTEGCDGVVSREAVQREGRCCLFGSRGCDDWQRLEGSGGGEVGWCAGGAEQVSKVGSPFALDTANLRTTRLGGVEGVGE